MQEPEKINPYVGMTKEVFVTVKIFILSALII